MATVQLLEDRIKDLETQVYGLQNTGKIDDVKVESPVIDNLLHANTLISSALSGREKANIAVKRLPELNKYLDPASENTEISTEAKLQLLLTTQKDIKSTYALLHQMQELMPALESDRLQKVTELKGSLHNLNFSYLKLKEEVEGVNSQVNEMFSKYNDLITSISKSLITLDNAVRAAEIAAKPKKQLD